MQRSKMVSYIKRSLCGWGLVILSALSGEAQLNDGQIWQAPPSNPPHVELPGPYITPTERMLDHTMFLQ